MPHLSNSLFFGLLDYFIDSVFTYFRPFTLIIEVLVIVQYESDREIDLSAVRPSTCYSLIMKGFKLLPK